MRTLKISLLVLILPINLFAQSPDTLWTKIFGASGSDVGISLEETYEGGYIIAGFTTSFGAGYDDAYLIKTNEYGDTLWTRTFGGMFGDMVNTVYQTIDSGYVLGGNTYPAGWEDSNFWLIKTDKNGDMLWTKEYGLNDYEWCIDMSLTSDSGYVLIGSTGPNNPLDKDLWIVKTNKYGEIEWDRILGGSLLDAGFEVQEITSGDYILIGVTESYGIGNDDIWLIKLDDEGNTLWTKTYGGPEDDVGVSVRETINGDFIVAGTTTSFGAGERDIWIIKTDEYGDTLWTKTFGGSDGERVEYICSTIDSSYIIVGYTVSFGAGSGDAWLFKINESGEILWQRTLGGIGDDLLSEVKQTSDSGYIAVGSTNTNGHDVWLIKLESDIVANLDNLSGQPYYNLIQNYPNPFNPTTKIKFTIPIVETRHASSLQMVSLKVFDILGREIATLVNEEKSAGEYEVEFNAANLPAGIYFYQLKAGEYRETKKMVLLR